MTRANRPTVAMPALLIAFLAIAHVIVPTSAWMPWDFQTYRLAGMAAVLGSNPYDAEQLARLAGRPVGMPFVYPPITVWLFAPFALLRLWPGAITWLVLKLGLLFLMVRLWNRRFLPDLSVMALCACVAFGFNASAIWDLKVGNVAILEQACVWIGLSAFVEGRTSRAAVAIVAGALFKLAPAAFLGLLLVPARTRGPEEDRRSRWRAAGIGAAALACLVVVPLVLGPEWTRGYLGNIPADRPWGYANPSALGLIDTLSGVATGAHRELAGRNVLLWLVYVAAVLALGARWIRCVWRARDARLWGMTAALAYPLLHPRPMSYGYLMALPAALWLVPKCMGFRGSTHAVCAALIAPWVLIPALRLNYANPWVANAPFFLLLAFWAIVALRGPAAADTMVGIRSAADGRGPVR